MRGALARPPAPSAVLDESTDVRTTDWRDEEASSASKLLSPGLLNQNSSQPMTQRYTHMYTYICVYIYIRMYIQIHICRNLCR